MGGGGFSVLSSPCGLEPKCYSVISDCWPTAHPVVGSVCYVSYSDSCVVLFTLVLMYEQ